MDEPSENFDNEPIEEAEDPARNIKIDSQSEEEDDFPEFGNDENKKLNQLVLLRLNLDSGKEKDY